jgi:hypothetical protein
MLRISPPLINGLQLCCDTGKTVIVYPSPPDFYQLFQPFLNTVRTGFLGDLLELAFERFSAVLFHYQSHPLPGSSLKTTTGSFLYTQPSR